MFIKSIAIIIGFICGLLLGARAFSQGKNISIKLTNKTNTGYFLSGLMGFLTGSIIVDLVRKAYAEGLWYTPYLTLGYVLGFTFIWFVNQLRYMEIRG